MNISKGNSKGHQSHKGSKSHKVVKKTVKKQELEAFSQGKNLMDLMEEEQFESKTKVVSNLIKGKKAAKEEIFCQLDKKGRCLNKADLRMPLMLIFATDINGEKELFPRENLFKLLEGLMVLNMKIVVIDTQQPSDLSNLSALSTENARHITWYNPLVDDSGLEREAKEIDRLLLAADLAMIFDQQRDLLKLLLSYGVVMVAEDKSPFLENYKPNEEAGNSFLYSQKDLWSIFAALVRALETYKFPYDWQHIVRNMLK
jgi:hypothetical protein